MTVIEYVREAVRAERDRVIEIAELCAACPLLIPGFIRDGTSPGEVRRELAKQTPAAVQQRIAFDPAWITQQLERPTLQ